MKTRIITALLIIICVIPPLIFGGWLIQLLLAFIVIAGGIELLSLSEHKSNWPIIIKPLAILCVFILILAPAKTTTSWIAIIALAFLSIPIWTDHFHANDAFLSIAYVITFFAIANSFLEIYQTNTLYVWYIIIATYVCDTCAFFCGFLFGKHKLNVRISPKKTWEGAIGGWFFASLISFAFAYFFLPSIDLWVALLASCLMAITGQIGDLAFSAIKRCFQIKDFSNLLPGHGGVLDRVDSLVFNFICFHMILVVFIL